MRRSVVYALAALSLLHCKVDSDDSGDGARGAVSGPSGMGGSAGDGGKGSAGSGGDQLGTGGKGTAGMAGMAGAGSGGMGMAGAGSGGMKGPGGAGGMSGTGGMSGSGGMGGTGGMMMGSGGMSAPGGDTESGRMVGMTAAHNVVRAEVDTDAPLPMMTWDAEIAEYAQEWADGLNASCEGRHRTTHQYGENIASFGSTAPGNISTAKEAVDGWAGEVACWTYGDFMRGDACNMSCTSQMSSDGCGHYTQVVWRNSIKVGCGVTTCDRDGFKWDIWVCNYSPVGNIVGDKVY